MARGQPVHFMYITLLFDSKLEMVLPAISDDRLRLYASTKNPKLSFSEKLCDLQNILPGRQHASIAAFHFDQGNRYTKAVPNTTHSLLCMPLPDSSGTTPKIVESYSIDSACLGAAQHTNSHRRSGWFFFRVSRSRYHSLLVELQVSQGGLCSQLPRVKPYCFITILTNRMPAAIIEYAPLRNCKAQAAL